MTLADRDSPLAIAMWDFSWLERRYPGGGYEDWGRALDELAERGYDAVRIDAYPHLVATDPDREWVLPPAFDACDWGAPATCRVEVTPALTEFIGACADRDIAVALSSWFREDETGARLGIRTPADLAAVWVDTLDRIADAGLLDALCWVDLCNEFPLPQWAPYFNDPDADHRTPRDSPAGRRWIDDSIGGVREAYPDQEYCLSETVDLDTWSREPAAEMDLLEPHIWLMNATGYYDWERDGGDIDSDDHYEWVVDEAEARYRNEPDYWREQLGDAIDAAAEWSRETGLPLATTESWALIHYKDWPGLDWEWIREVCAFGTRRAAETGRWAAISTSNFCGPQFEGMWADAEWHREQTDAIKDATIGV
ncbi:cellulase-like family protein [Halosimplex halobium]|uniref:cellulase-like family protein n=1 Tax=Halosimplex halobium TaxID=3396618 RepID=UPI003F567A61